MNEAYLSLVTNDDYGCGAVVLGRSLKRTGTQRKCVLFVTAGVSATKRSELSNIWDELIDVEALDSNDKEKLAILSRPELGCTFTKLKAWTLTQFKKCIFLDADTLVLQNVDELFERKELSASPDIGWPDCFNSGVFVFVPSLVTYNRLLEHAKTKGSFDGGDQGLLNEFFSEWATGDIATHLPFTYNMVSSVTYSYTPAFIRFGQNVKIVHFLGAVKPWHQQHCKETSKVQFLPTTSRQSQSEHIFTQMWWDLHMVENVSASGDPPSITESKQHSPASWQRWENARVTYASDPQRTAWEHGTPDYLGEDRFDNILTHMKAVILDDTPPTKITTTAMTDAKTTATESKSIATVGETIKDGTSKKSSE